MFVVECGCFARMFDFFPSLLVCSSFQPSIIILQIIPSCFFNCFRSDVLVDIVFPSLFRSSNTSVRIRRGAESRVPSCGFFVHLSSECDAILVVNHFNFHWVSIQHGMLAARILSSASLVFLLMYSIHPPSSISSVSMSSSESLWKDTLLSWSHPILVLFSSSHSVGVVRWLLSSSVNSFSSLLFCLFVSFEGCAGASCVASIESFSRAQTLTSKWQSRTSSWVRRPS